MTQTKQKETSESNKQTTLKEATLDFILLNQLDDQLARDLECLNITFPTKHYLDMLCNSPAHVLALKYIIETKLRCFSTDSNIVTFPLMRWREIPINFDPPDFSDLNGVRNHIKNRNLFVNPPLYGVTGRFNSIPSTDSIITLVSRRNGYILAKCFGTSSINISNTVETGVTALSFYGKSVVLSEPDFRTQLATWVEDIFFSLTRKKVNEIYYDKSWNSSSIPSLTNKLILNLSKVSPEPLKPIISLCLANATTHGVLLQGYSKLLALAKELKSERDLNRVFIEHIPDVLDRLPEGDPLRVSITNATNELGVEGTGPPNNP